MEKALLSVLRQKWKNLLEKGQDLTFQKGQVLFYAGHEPCGIYLLRSGRVKFIKEKSSCEGAHFWDSPTGQVIGVDHLFGRHPFCCTCKAVQNCEVTFVSKTLLLPLLQEEGV